MSSTILSTLELTLLPVDSSRMRYFTLVKRHLIFISCFFLAGFLAMTERKMHDNRFQRKWVMCPTCRQHTDFGNIAYADDRQDKSCSSAMLDAIQGCEKTEASLAVQGSYGTKVYFLI